MISALTIFAPSSFFSCSVRTRAGSSSDSDDDDSDTSDGSDEEDDEDGGEGAAEHRKYVITNQRSSMGDSELRELNRNQTHGGTLAEIFHAKFIKIRKFLERCYSNKNMGRCQHWVHDISSQRY